MGHDSELYALAIDDELRGNVREFSHPEAKTGDITIFHFALPSPMSAEFGALRRGRVLQYHNVTPARFFAPYEPALYRLASIAREELAGLANVTDLALGDSEYNRQELEGLNFSKTGVMASLALRNRFKNTCCSLCSTPWTRAGEGHSSRRSFTLLPAS